MTNPTEAKLLQPGGLARELRRHRSEAGLTGVALAERMGEGWTQPRISKLENGKQLPTEQDVRDLGQALGLADETIENLLDLRTQAAVITRSWHRGREQGQAAIQRQFDEVVRAAGVIRNHEVNVVPGLLQTAGYARSQAMQAVNAGNFDVAEVDATVAERIARQQVLEDTSKRFEFCISEAVLRMGYCPADVMLAQLGKLLDVTRAPSHIWFGIIPFGVDIPTVPIVPFLLLDDERFIVEHFSGDLNVADAAEVKLYAQGMDRLKDEAVTGEQARGLIVDAMRWLSTR